MMVEVGQHLYSRAIGKVNSGDDVERENAGERTRLVGAISS